MILLDISVDEVALDFVDPIDFVYAYRGRVVDQDDATERRRTIGRFELRYVDIGAAMDAEQDIFEIFEATSETLTEVYEGLFDGSGRVITLVEDLLQSVMNPNILVIERIEIVRSAAGRGLGRAVLKRLMERFAGGVSLVVLKAFPLQFEPKGQPSGHWRARLLPRGRFAGIDEEAATIRLRQYYSEIGFKLIPKTSLMALSLDLHLP